MMKSKKGMTLMEIMVVIIIMAILACIVLPKFTGQTERGIVAEGIQGLSAIRQAEEAWRLDNSDSYTTALGSLDIDLTQTKFVYTIVAGAGPTFTATATRQPAGTCNNTYNGCTITLDNTGTWGGSHPFKPT